METGMSAAAPQQRGPRSPRTRTPLEKSVKENLAKTLKERNLEFRFKPVEDAMAPLIHQVTSLTEFDPASLKKEETQQFIHQRRQFGSPHKLVQLVDKAVMNFVAVGEDIAAENPEFRDDLLLACEEVRSKGEALHSMGSVFVQDTSLPDKRASMVRAARELLFSITRLMVLADIIDVNNLLNASGRVEEKLKALLSARSEREVVDKIQDFTTNIAQITQTTTMRLNETKCKTSLQMLAAVQTELNQASRMLVSASKAFLHDPAVKPAEENREFIIDGMLQSLKTLSLLADGEDPAAIESHAMGMPAEGDLVASFANFEATLDSVNPDPDSPVSPQVTASLHTELEAILQAAAQLADSAHTRDHRQHTLISQSGALKAGLQALTGAELGPGGGGSGPGGGGGVDGRGEALRATRRSSTALKQELHRVAVDHMSDAFVDALGPLEALVRAAHDGDRQQVDSLAEHFQQHAHDMLKTAFMLSRLSKDVDGIQMVKMASKHVQTLIPQVTRAAQTLVVQPGSQVLQKNMAVFRESWRENVTLLTSSVDAIAPLLDFLVVTEAHLHEDSKALLQAARGEQRGSFEGSVNLVRGRSGRVAHVVRTELQENPTRYSEEKRAVISSKVDHMLGTSLKAFDSAMAEAGRRLEDIHSQVECQSRLEDTTERVMEDVRELCREMLETRSPSEQVRMQAEVDEMLHPPRPLTPSLSLLSEVSSITSLENPPDSLVSPKMFQRTPQHSQVFETKDSAKSVMAQLSTEQQAQLAKVTADFTAQQQEFENVARKWDADSDIVLLAKEMCMMMMDMSDFTRGIGNLHSIMDLVVTAKDISRAGEYLSSMACSIAEQCPDSKSKKDLQAYVDQIRLYCHQLKITSAVRADIKNSSRETADSASALITAAKNLMYSVVETVKTSYIASRAIAKLHGGSMPDQFTQWRMTGPTKKGLEHHRDMTKSTPIHQLGQFKPDKKAFYL